MNKRTLIGIVTAICAVALVCTSCDKDDSVTALSNYDSKLKAVTDEVTMTKKHDKALLLVTFGSTWDEPQKTFSKMKEQFAKAFPDRDVYFAFTSNICITRCAAKNLFYYDPAFYLQAIGNADYKNVAVQSLHVIPGEEYLTLQSKVKEFHNTNEKFEKIEVCLGAPLLNGEEDVDAVADILNNKMKAELEKGNVVTFMGHGNPQNMNYGNGNKQYLQMEKALQKYNPNYFVATVDMEDNFVDDMIKRMEKEGVVKGKSVICHPLMSIAGDHANNDMKGGTSATNPEEGSWRAELSNAGYLCPLNNCIIKGLADYPEIVNVWINHTKEAIESGNMFE